MMFATEWLPWGSNIFKMGMPVYSVTNGLTKGKVGECFMVTTASCGEWQTTVGKSTNSFQQKGA
jgi:hypothetical protein